MLPLRLSWLNDKRYLSLSRWAPSSFCSEVHKNYYTITTKVKLYCRLVAQYKFTKIYIIKYHKLVYTMQKINNCLVMRTGLWILVLSDSNFATLPIPGSSWHWNRQNINYYIKYQIVCFFIYIWRQIFSKIIIKNLPVIDTDSLIRYLHWTFISIASCVLWTCPL